MPQRVKQMLELTSSACEDCRFEDTGACTVPGRTCIRRPIGGISGYYVGDVLANIGVIDKDWDDNL